MIGWDLRAWQSSRVSDTRFHYRYMDPNLYLTPVVCLKVLYKYGWWGCKNCNSHGPSSFVVVSKIILSGSGLTPWPAQPMDVIAPAARNRHIGSVMICVLCCCVYMLRISSYMLRIYWTYWCFMFTMGFFNSDNKPVSSMRRPHHAKSRKNPHLSFNFGSEVYQSCLDQTARSNVPTLKHSSIFVALWCVMKGPLLLFFRGEIPYRKDSSVCFLTLSFEPHVYVKWWFLSFLECSVQQHKICDAVHIMHLELSTMESWQGFLDACLIHRWRICLSSDSLDASKKGETKLQIRQFQR